LVTFFNYPASIQIDKFQVVAVYGHVEVTKLRYRYIYISMGGECGRDSEAPKTLTHPPTFPPPCIIKINMIKRNTKH